MSLGNAAAHIYRLGHDQGVTLSVNFHIGRGAASRDFAARVIDAARQDGINATLTARGGFLGKARLYGIRHNGNSGTIALLAAVLERALADYFDRS